MQQLFEAAPFLAAPLVACVVIAALHCYMGLHVLKRGVIFVDLALAQTAALGAAVALFLSPMLHIEHEHGAHETGPVTTESQLADMFEAEGTDAAATVDTSAAEHDDHDAVHEENDDTAAEWFGRGMSLLFALLGALLLSFGRLRDERIPHEAIIGIIFVVCASLSVLILSKAPHGHEKMEAMLVGNILFVNWSDVGLMALLYAVLGVFHLALCKKFLHISKDVRGADRTGHRVRLWDCLFYGSFALMVTQSVSVAGVLVVFSFLIIPAACSVLFARGFGRQLLLAWGIAVVVTVAGLAFSAIADMPTGASLVSCFGAALVICVALRSLAGGAKEGVA